MITPAGSRSSVLDGWPGTLLVVSHDRYFLERVCSTTVSLMGDGSLLVKLDAREAELHAAMAASATDHEAVVRLNEELHQVRREKESVEESWLELSEQV